MELFNTADTSIRSPVSLEKAASFALLHFALEGKYPTALPPGLTKLQEALETLKDAANSHERYLDPTVHVEKESLIHEWVSWHFDKIKNVVVEYEERDFHLFDEYDYDAFIDAFYGDLEDRYSGRLVHEGEGDHMYDFRGSSPNEVTIGNMMFNCKDVEL